MLDDPRPVQKMVPDGHFYSPFVNASAIEARKDQLWPELPPLRGIDYREAAQHALFDELVPFMREFDFPTNAPEPPGFFLENNFFSELDALVYFGLLRKLRPKRVLEIGAGFSTMLAVQTRERFLSNGSPELPLIVCIEPYPTLERIAPIMEKVHFVPQPVWELDPRVVDDLEAGDILFIDGSHVSKIGSDTHTIYFDLLPRLAAGVYVHVHDIMLPFEYPYEWMTRGGCHWNEQYLLLALLTDSARYEITFGSSFFGAFHTDAVRAVFGKPLGGSSFWLRVRDDARCRRAGAP